MKVIEHDVRGQHIFTISYESNNRVDRLVRIETKRVTIAQVNYYLLYSSEFQVIREAYRFINCNQFSIIPTNTKLHYFYSLKYLFEYGEIFDKNVFDLSADDILKLRYFLSGFNSKVSNNDLHLLTERSSSTIDSCIYVYRKFYDFMGLQNKPIHSRYSVSRKSNKGTRKGKKDSSVPKYISTNDFKKILFSIEEMNCDFKTKLRNEVLVRIMFESGTRLGETLGLTFEDVKLYRAKNGVSFGVLFLRNRVSDENYQSAKTTSKVDDIPQYRGDYFVKGIGYQSVIISGYTYSILNEYINFIRDPQIYLTRNSKADNVTEDFGEINSYIFRNSLGSRLSNVTWNSVLRDIYKSSDIFIDNGKRTHNLSHRLRHGFIMRLIHEFPDHVEEIKKLSRHRSYESTFRYYNPTDEEISSDLERISSIQLGEYFDNKK